MSRIGIVRVVAAAFALAVLAAGCGGSDSGSTATDTSSSAQNERLTTGQWATYEAAAEPFTAANAEMLKRYNACPRSGTGDTTVFAKCLGDSLTTVEAATRELTTTLAGFNGTVSGTCATSLAAYNNYTTPYLASITSMQSAIDTENAAAFETDYAGAILFADPGFAFDRATGEGHGGKSVP